ncbi:MAG: rRNA maturation RNase YbeY [Verrucomicrobia bacterium]|nr:rRNA maturation RNase YbeY [Verrucomicrobiota bacterium]
MRTGKKRNVQIYNPCKALEFNHQAVDDLFLFLDEAASHSIPTGDLSLAFLDQEAHCQLHADFLDDPTPTDVITFPGDPKEDLAGEICVSIDTAYSYAKTHTSDFSKELTLYLVHGWLHLAGFDDLNEKDRQVMKKQEQVYMSTVETNGKVPLFKYLPNE